MTHPLSEDLSKLSSDELDKKHSEILKRYNISRRMNMLPYVINQLELMLSGIEYERYSRLDKLDPKEDPVVIDTDRPAKTGM
jgi:hypothetical protein